MSYKFKMVTRNAIINFSEEYCRSSIELINSVGFSKVTAAFVRHKKKLDDITYRYLTQAAAREINITADLKKISRLLLIMDSDELCAAYPELKGYFKSKRTFLNIIEEYYLFWRRYERYAVIYADKERQGLQSVQFTSAIMDFENLVLTTYRRIQEAGMRHENRVYRQISAGVNAGLIAAKGVTALPKEYRNLDNVPVIQQTVINPPFITYTKRNTRDGVFPEVDYNPIDEYRFDEDAWFCYPAKVGDSLAFVYFNSKYMSQGITLSNLFEMAAEDEYRNRKPDLIYVYGYEDGERNQCFYHDKKNDMMIGLVSAADEFDYFGYMKKMMLTLHNVRKINMGQVPIHGAMMRITLRSGRVKNIIVMGDSGAGKSETVEQLKAVGSEEIIDLKTIYDDMGFLFIEEGKVKSSGTEVGAFVRLDDLDTGYGYKEIDRSVFMNPDKKNARIVIPITDYTEVIAHHHIDYFLYANNYEEGKEGSLEYMDNMEEILSVFRAGRRMAKGTTTEMGLVESFFANPFGPVQRKEQTDRLIVEYFDKMQKQGIKIGQLHTCLGIKGMEHEGPRKAAGELLAEITK